MGTGHEHGGAIAYEKPLWWAFGLTLTFLVRSHRWAVDQQPGVASRCGYMGTDVNALAIALVAVRLSRRHPDASAPMATLEWKRSAPWSTAGCCSSWPPRSCGKPWGDSGSRLPGPQPG